MIDCELKQKVMQDIVLMKYVGVAPLVVRRRAEMKCMLEPQYRAFCQQPKGNRSKPWR